MIKVFTAGDVLEAHFVKSLLAGDGVGAEVQGEELFGLRPLIGLEADTFPSVWILDDTQLDKALETISDYKRDQLPSNK